LYEEHGERCVEYLRGMFAFAIWDGKRDTVFLARDRLGIKPLFYQASGNRLLFASELKAMLQDPLVTRRLDLDAVRSFLTYGYVPGDQCVFTGLSKLEPGHTLTWRRGSIRISRYWDVQFKSGVARSDGEYLDECRALLREA